MNKRKFLGTIIGLIFWSICIMFFTYAYYDWKSESTNVVLGIEDLSVECLVGSNVEAFNIGPVLDYKDGVITEFSINNGMAESMTIELYLDITSISDASLLTVSLKYAIVSKNVESSTYDYTNPIKEGTFTNFNIGNNLITQDLEVMANTTTNYQFIIYIDGNMYNVPNMQENSITANLMIGNCDGSSIPYDELVYQAIYSDIDKSLTFVHTKPLTVGDTYNDKTVTAVYAGFDTVNYTSQSNVPWYKDGNYQYIETVSFDSIVKPKSTAYWFYQLNNLKNIDLSKLDTSTVTTMSSMFNGCSSLISLDVSNFITNKVTDMGGMFKSCSSLISLDVSNFNTSKVANMGYMFNGCSSLTNLDVSNFDTSSVTNMYVMFSRCSSLISLDLGNFNTSRVTSIGGVHGGMFDGCESLISVNLSSFDTSNFDSLSFMYMFRDCYSLVELDLSNFDTKNITNMQYMFEDCYSLVELELSNFDTSNVTSYLGTFYNAKKVITSLTIMNTDANFTNFTNYSDYLARITLYYIEDNPETTDINESTESIVNSLVNGTKIINGGCKGKYCPIET